MKRIVLLLCFLEACLTLSGQGLHFRGSEFPIEERTSMETRLRKAFTDSLVLRFDLALTREHDSGYIFRIGHLSNDDNTGGVCLFMDSNGDEYQFRVIWEGHRFVSMLSFPKSSVREGEWLPVYFKLDPVGGNVLLTIRGLSSVGELELDRWTKTYLSLGKNEYRIDVPSFDLKNLSVKMNQDLIEFPLNEDSGNIASSSSPLMKAKVSNPEWLNQDRLHWKKRFTKSSREFLTCGYDVKRHEVYIISKDSLSRIPLGKGSPSRVNTDSPNPLHTFLGSSFPSDNGYCCYEVYYGEEVPEDTPTMAFLDEDSRWNILSKEQFPTQLHHHNLITDTLRNRRYLYGGFGNRLYNGRFLCLDSIFRWIPMEQLHGDEVWPRYFASAGWDPETDRIYLFGGMGNESGDHIVGRQYMYDFFSINPDTFEAEKVWTHPTPWPNKVPVRNMVLPGDECFYTLMYPESNTETELQLCRFSLKDGQMQEYANAIPMNSDRILTNANLYFDDDLQKLVAVIEESSNDIDSKVTVYTLSFPPMKQSLSTVSRQKIKLVSALLLAGLLAGVVLFFKARRKSKTRHWLKASIPATTLGPLKPTPNSIFLFGDFAAFDAKGNDISNQFPEKIRQLLILILSGGEKGASSKRLRATLWPDKDDEHAKNLRGVTMNKLRKALSQMDGASIVFEENHFILKHQELFHCDLFMYRQILQSEEPDMDTLIRLLSRGKILLGESDPMFDKMKEDIEQQIHPIMLSEMKRRLGLKEYANAILCADILFQTDPLDEDALAAKVQALRLLGREEEARSIYQVFISRYKREYGEEYGTPYPRT